MNKKFNSGLIILLLLVTALLYTSPGYCRESAGSEPSSVHTLIVEPDDGKAELINAIRNVKKSIKLTIYELDDPDILSALQSAAGRGVDVRIIYNLYSFYDKKQQKILDAMKQLETQGIKTKAANRVYTNTHEKTFVFDDNKAIIMSFNLQASYFSTTRDFGIVTVSDAEISEISAVFEADWNYQDITPSQESLVWSPVNSREKLIRLIRSAKKTLEIYNEEVEDKEVIEELIRAAQSGVEVRFISAQLMGYSGRDGNAYGRKRLNENGVKAKYGDFLYIHAKMILADYGTDDAKAFVGSENFSYTSLNKNRELGILIRKNQILDRLHSIFEGDWVKCKYDGDSGN